MCTVEWWLRLWLVFASCWYSSLRCVMWWLVKRRCCHGSDVSQWQQQPQQAPPQQASTAEAAAPQASPPGMHTHTSVIHQYTQRLAVRFLTRLPFSHRRGRSWLRRIFFYFRQYFCYKLNRSLESGRQTYCRSGPIFNRYRKDKTAYRHGIRRSKQQ